VLVARGWKPGRASSEQYRALSAAFDGLSFTHLEHAEERKYFRVPRDRLRWLTQWRRRRVVAPRLRNIVLDGNAALIHAHTEGEAPLAVRIARLCGVPAVVTIHGINTAPDYLKAKDHREEIARALNEAARIILVGDSLRAFVKELTGRDDHFRIVPNGVFLPAMDPVIILDEPNVRFVSVSNLHEGKGIDIALRALAELSARGSTNWRYTIVGDGKERVSLEALASELGILANVTFVGAVENTRVWALLRAADVFVLPSYIESFGIAYLEAMATGLLAVGVRGQGPAAFIENGVSGFLVKPQSHAALADCLASVFSQRESARRIAARGTARVAESFTWDSHAARLVDVYSEALAHG